MWLIAVDFYVICRARLLLAPQILKFILDSSSLVLYLDHCFSFSRTQLYGSCHMYFMNGAEVVNSQVTSVLSVWSGHTESYVYQASQAGNWGGPQAK